MIPLSIQLKSIAFSFLYGIIFSFLTSMNYKYIYNTKGAIKIIINILFVVNNTIIYFFILKLINDGIIHYYFIIFLVIGFFCVNKLSNKIFKVDKH